MAMELLIHPAINFPVKRQRFRKMPTAPHSMP